jgi:competence protein ComFC
VKLLDLLFPKQCLGCGKCGQYLCERCIAPQLTKQKCIVCEKWAIDGFTHPRCIGKYTIDRTISIWDYNGTVRKAIISLKYKFAKEIAGELVTHIIKAIDVMNLQISSNSIILPIPMHWKRKNWRGFNQVEEIGKSLSQSISEACRFEVSYEPNLLVRIQQNKPQAGLKRTERATNISGVFSVSPNYSPLAISDKLCILFDDVYTTGATLKEAGKVLKQNGAKRVWALTIARR